MYIVGDRHRRHHVFVEHSTVKNSSLITAHFEPDSKAKSTHSCPYKKNIK